MRPRLQVRLSEQIDKAIAAHCKRQKLTVSEFVVGAICHAMQKPALAETVRPVGRPPKPPETTAK
jgi:uncharacterized protein (DUF1778 family)